MLFYILDYFYPEEAGEPVTINISDAPTRRDERRVHFKEEEKAPIDYHEINSDPIVLIDIIVNNKYLKKEICAFFKIKGTSEELIKLNKSFKYWVAFINVSSMYLKTPRVDEVTNIYYHKFWNDYYILREKKYSFFGFSYLW